MASIATRQPGSQAEAIISSFSRRNHAPVAGVGAVDWSNLLSTSVGRGFDFLDSRFGTPAGTLVQQSDGSMVYRQPTGSNVTLPITNQQYGLQTPEGFSTGIATGTMVMVGAGVLILVLLMKKR